MKNKRIISLIMCIIMALSIVGSSIYYFTTTVGAVSPKDIDKLVVDFRNEVSFGANASAYKHKPSTSEPDPNTGGVFSFDAEKQALKLQYSPVERQSPYRIMMYVKGLTTAYKYWVVVYASETDQSYDFYLHNTPKQGERVNIATSAKSTNGKFVVSDVFDISKVENNKSIVERWSNSGIVNTLAFDSSDTDANFYIKEMGFFKTVEDAKAYYAAVDLSKPSSEYATDDSSRPESYFLVPFKETPVEEPVSTVKADPVILKLGDPNSLKDQKAYYYDHGDNLTHGIYEHVTEDGIPAVKITYGVTTEVKMPEYRVMLGFKNHPKITADHKYMRVTYKTDSKYSSQLVILNNGNRDIVPVIAENASVSKGEWTRTNVVDITSCGALDRFLKNQHCTLGFYFPMDTETFYISEIALFTSPDDAYSYYGDAPSSDGINVTRMTFGSGSTGTTLDGDTYGVHSYNSNTGALDITYARSTNVNVSYLAKIKFTDNGVYDSTYRYMRVLYAANNPDGIENASMYMRTDAQHHVFKIVDKLKNTDGKFVMSDTVLIDQLAADRFAGTGDYKTKAHNSLYVNCTKPGGTYSIKAVFFFSTRADADAFVYDDTPSSITVNGNDIAKYSIVIANDPSYHAEKAAEVICDRIYELSGVRLPIITDDMPETEYEITVGLTNRSGSSMDAYADLITGERFNSFAIAVNGTKAHIASELPAALASAAENFNRYYLYGTSMNVPKVIDMGETVIVSNVSGLRQSPYTKLYTNVDTPTVYTDDFDADDGYWQEESYGTNWKFENGRFTVKASEGDYSYLQIFEQNVIFKANVKFENAAKNGEFALMLRQNSADAWVKAGYDFFAGEWFIDYREGLDFYTVRAASVKAAVAEGKEYKLEFKLDGLTATLSVDGKQILTSDGIAQKSPGKVAFYAENITASFDDADITFLSGLGTLMKNTYHTYLDPNRFAAGGTVLEYNDGSLRYLYGNTLNMISYDGGLTWQYCDAPFDYMGTQPNIIRLNSGELIRMGKSGNSVVFLISEDDGKSWKQAGTVCQTPFRGDKSINAVAVNMNDKVFQSPTTDRIFYGQNYETTTSTFEGRKVFCEFYYSDDKGYTWTKSDTDSWEIEGNEKATHFGECKLLECSDGTIRMYTSWNKYGCIVYSESKDNGKTFGPLVMMPEFKCSLSSMQFFRDPSGETEHTYYMIWVYSVDNKNDSMPRSRLSLAKSTDGKSWVYIGDLWRWESNYRATNASAIINHIVNPFIYVTDKYIFAGSGTSERMADDPTATFHQLQRQNIWTVDKSTLGEGISLNVFDDVNLGSRAYDAITFVTAEGLFNGMSDNIFAPEVTMNRSMFVTVLGRLDKADTEAYKEPTFSDVKAGQWYTSYVEWAAANGIVNGLGNGVYGVSNAVTIEQACTILYRYNGGKAGSLEGASLSDFSDTAGISSWAAEAMKWAVENGVYEGLNGKLTPTSAATRADVAMIFANYVKAFG